MNGWLHPDYIIILLDLIIICGNLFFHQCASVTDIFLSKEPKGSFFFGQNGELIIGDMFGRDTNGKELNP